MRHVAAYHVAAKMTRYRNATHHMHTAEMLILGLDLGLSP